MSCHLLLQGILPTQGSNPCLLNWQTDSLPLSHQGSLLCDMSVKNVITKQTKQSGFSPESNSLSPLASANKSKSWFKKKKKSIWKCKTWTQTTCYIFLLQFNMVISKLFLFLTQFLSHILINTGGLPCPLRTWKWGIQDDTLKVKLKFNT